MTRKRKNGIDDPSMAKRLSQKEKALRKLKQRQHKILKRSSDMSRSAEEILVDFRRDDEVRAKSKRRVHTRIPSRLKKYYSNQAPAILSTKSPVRKSLKEQRMEQRVERLIKNATAAEIKLYRMLRREYGHCIVFQKAIVMKDQMYYILDLYHSEAKLAIELDGSHHREEKQFEYDRIRDSRLLREQGIRTFRFSNEVVFANIVDVLDIIHHEIVRRLGVKCDDNSRMRSTEGAIPPEVTPPETSRDIQPQISSHSIIH